MSRALSPVRRPLPPGILLSTFVRSLLIQGSWNYRTMLGSGFAFAMIPALRRLFGDEPDEMRDSVERHIEHFNAHPYLSSLAIGAVLRLEADGADPETIRRLKVAIRGPLGSLGDALVWATILPGVAMAALCLFWFDVPVWVAVIAFLAVFNLVHVGLRIWGFRAGMRAGKEVGRLLTRADLSGWTRRLEPLVVLLLGLFVGSVLGGDGGLLQAGALWIGLAVAAFVVGLFGGHRTWRPAAVVTVLAIGVLSVVGVLA